MTNTELLQPLNEILARAQKLMHLAQIEEWQAMEDQAAQYQQHVAFLNDEVYLQAINAAHLTSEAKDIIAQIQAVNNSVDIYASLRRDKIASDLRQVLQAGKAKKAYRQ